MIVKFINPEREDFFLCLNKEYIVLSVQTTVEGVFYRILSDNDNGPILVKVDNFILTENSIPFDWVSEIEDNNFCIEPREFCNDFWERYYEEEKEAEKIFYRVYQKLKKFHGWNE